MENFCINFWGAPGCGKSTTASWLYYKMKVAKIDVELSREYIKELIQEGNRDASSLSNIQYFITAEQLRRTNTCTSKVVVSDSPPGLGAFYARQNGLFFAKPLEDLCKSFNDNSTRKDIHIFLERQEEDHFNNKERIHTAEESSKLNNILKIWFKENYGQDFDLVTTNKNKKDIIEFVLGSIK